MGCTSAKHVSSVPSEEEEEGGGKAKAYQNGDAFGDQYKLKAVEEVKYMRSGDEDGVTARNQENLEKSASSNRNKSQKDGSGANSQRANIHTSESQQEFFRMLDEKIEKGPDYSSEEEKDIT
ncbi:uncharacterized protein C1orf21 homolog isoform X2 [Acipenser ruthenus]|uniref:uncharacterized protein C1orf21 homolog isoform X2 n=1 Tax=Acipenser ruthenus TaxID=7906 RepID=UPI00145B0DB9|nr:uncharacterized protein C1orf21 homolog isoform X2 [Acipenser ruthenus]